MNSQPGLPYLSGMSASFYSQYTPRATAYAPPPYVQPPRPAPSTYELKIQQGPERAKLVSRDKSKDRKPIDPPPIIQCLHSDERAAYNPYLFCAVTLFDEEKDEPKHSDSSTSLLVGSTVSSAHRLKGLNNDEGTFFVFGDLAPSCQGPARLYFVLYELKDNTIKAHATITSKVFEVSNAKEWDGVKESTVLSRTFADQGVKLRLKKESRNARRGIPSGYAQMPSSTQANLLPQIQPQIQPQTPYQHYPQSAYYAQSPAYAEDDDAESRGSKRQRLSSVYSGGQSYAGYAPSPQSPIPSSYPAYASHDATPHTYNLPYHQQQQYARGAAMSHQSSTPNYSQVSPQAYSPQQSNTYRRPTYYTPQPQQQAQQSVSYGSYGLATPAQYPTQTYAPVESASQSYDSAGTSSYGPSQHPAGQLPPLPPIRTPQTQAEEGYPLGPPH